MIRRIVCRIILGPLQPRRAYMPYWFLCLMAGTSAAYLWGRVFWARLSVAPAVVVCCILYASMKRYERQKNLCGKAGAK